LARFLTVVVFCRVTRLPLMGDFVELTRLLGMVVFGTMARLSFIVVLWRLARFTRLVVFSCLARFAPLVVFWTMTRFYVLVVFTGMARFRGLAVFTMMTQSDPKAARYFTIPNRVLAAGQCQCAPAFPARTAGAYPVQPVHDLRTSSLPESASSLPEGPRHGGD